MRKLIHLVLIAALLCVVGFPAMMPCCDAPHAATVRVEQDHCHSHGVHAEMQDASMAPHDSVLMVLPVAQHCVGAACGYRATREGNPAEQPAEQNAIVRMESQPVAVATLAFHRSTFRPPSPARLDVGRNTLPLRV